MVETACQPQAQHRILHTLPTAKEKDALFRRHPFLSRFGTRRRNKIGEWLVVLAHRERLNTFTPCVVDETARKALYAKLHRFIANPSPENTEEFIGFAKANAGREVETDALRHDSILGQIRKGPAEAVKVPALVDVLRANGIFFGFFDESPHFSAAFMADILSYASLPFLARPAAYALERNSMRFFGNAWERPSGRSSLPVAWADGQQFIIPCGHGCEVDFVRPYTIQHEAQHIFDQRAMIMLDYREYTAYLAWLAFAPPCLGRFRDYKSYPNPTRRALEQIRYELMVEFGVGRNFSRLFDVSDAQLNAAALALLNAAYKREIGFTYDELVAPFRGMQLA